LYGLPRHRGFSANAVLTSNHCTALKLPLLSTLSIGDPAVLLGVSHNTMQKPSCRDDKVHQNGFSTSKNTFVTGKFRFTVTPSTDDHHVASCRGATYTMFAIDLFYGSTQVITPNIVHVRSVPSHFSPLAIVAKSSTHFSKE
jgi:hypothetical protein